MDAKATHLTHPDVLKRLKRVEGQLASIRAMIEADRPCLDVAQQLQAAESAVREAKKTFIYDHLDHCLDAAAGDGRRKGKQNSFDEFKAIAKYL
jgi:uncharacterized protein